MSTFSTCHVDLAIGWHCSSLYSFNVATPEYLYGEDEWHEMQCLCLLVLVWLQIYDCLISYPGSWWVGKEDSLLSTVADALSYPEILGNQELSCYILTTETSWSILTATLSVHFWPMITILEARHAGMKIFYSIDMLEVVMWTIYILSKVTAYWWEEPP